MPGVQARSDRREAAHATSFGAAGLAISGKSGITLLISRSCQILEFSGRGLFVNIPTFLLASFPEINRVCSVTTTYFLLQVVGICWAILLNAGFALACRVTYILPALNVDPSKSFTYTADLSNFSSSATAQLMASSYVAYASIRIMIAYGRNVFDIALQSTQDFPEAARQVVAGGVASLTITSAAFVPAIALQVGLIFADTMCIDVMGDLQADVGLGIPYADTAYRVWRTALPARDKICTHLGFHYFTTPHKHVRSLFFSVLLIMVLQIWQAYLQQFPRWNPVFMTMKPGPRAAFQMSALLLLFSTVGTLMAIIMRYTTGVVNTEQVVLFNMLGWTIWLYFFTLHLTKSRGELWSQTVSPKHIQHMLAYLRISQCLLLAIIFFYKAWLYGLLQAQLDLTFITLLLPALYSIVYLTSNSLLRVQHDLRLLSIGLTSCFIISIVITFFIAQTDAKGSAVLVFAHVVSKWIEFYDITVEGPEEFDLDGEYTDKERPPSRTPVPTTPKRSHPRIGSWEKEPGIAGSTTGQNLGGDVRNEEGNKVPFSPVSTYMAMTAKSPLRASRSCHALNNEGLGNTETSNHSSLDKLEGEQSLSTDRNRKNPSSLLNETHLPRRVNSASSLSTLIYQNDDETGTFSRQRTMSITTRYLNERGQVDNPLVSLGIPESVRKHWLLRVPKRNMRFLGNLLSWVGMGGYSGNNAYAGTIRVFVNIAMMLILLLTTVTIAAWAQRSLQMYPKLIDFKTDYAPAGKTQDTANGGWKAVPAHQYVHFDHKVSNVTLHFYPSTPEVASKDQTHSSSRLGSIGSKPSADINNIDAESNGNAAFELSIDEPNFFSNAAALEPPYYMACSWRWKGLSVFDFALLSQVAYFDDDQRHVKSDTASEANGAGEESGSIPHRSRVQTIIDTLFPDDDFVATNSHPDHLGIGPRFVEVYSAKLNITVLAVRGTDVGRLQDIMEDFKLYAEPIIFTLLSTAFPTIRWWNHETTARIIECLFEFNSFFGLQGEAEYYRPLAQRVLNIARATHSGDTCDKGHKKETTTEQEQGQRQQKSNSQHHLVITGHSLGGGLARIVGTLTGQASVSFGPPGLGLSYRKYSIEEENSDGNVIKIRNKAQMDHQSLAIVTAFDLVTQIDQQVGLIQNVQCDHQDKAVHTSACHLLEGTICHLLKHCGDPKGRFMTCESQFEVGVLGPTVSTFLWNYRYLTGPVVLVVVTFTLLAVVPALI